MSRRRSGVAVIAGAAALVALTLAGCTSSQGGTGTGAGAPVTTPVSSPSAPPSSSSSSASPTPTKTSRPPNSSSPAPSSKPPSSRPPSSSHQPPPPPTSSAPSGPPACTADQLTATGIRGGAYQGREVAGVLFTNSSGSTCSVRGYPFAQLRYQGGPLGKPASDNPGTVRTITLVPGHSAQSQLTAVTTCQAPISDHVRVRAPDTDQPKIVPMQLRGCSLSIDPLQPA